MSLACISCRINCSIKRERVSKGKRTKKEQSLEGKWDEWRTLCFFWEAHGGHLYKVILYKIDNFKGYKNKGLDLKYFSQFMPFKLSFQYL